MSNESKALDASAKKEIKRYARWSLVWLGVGLILLTIFMTAVVRIENRAIELERTGARVQGQIAHVGRRSIDLLFRWQGEERYETINIGDRSASTYRVNQQIVVFVDKADATHFTISGETNQSQGTVWPMVFALLFGGAATAVGSISLGRGIRQRRLLKSSVWQRFITKVRPHTVQYATGRRLGSPHRGARTILFLKKPKEESWYVLSVHLQSPFRLIESKIDSASEVDVAGDPERYVVARVPGSRSLISARAPRTRFFRERWRDAF